MGPEETFVRKLIEIEPKLEEHYRQHVADNDTLLPHVFMGDVTRYILAERARDVESIKRVLGFFESELASKDPAVRELIGASFVENLNGEQKARMELEQYMGSRLRREVQLIGGD